MERANQPETTTAQSATNTPPQGSSAAGIVQAIIATGKREPSEIAAIVKAHPTIAKDIIQVLQLTMGNAFVQTVLRYAGASIAAEAKPADGAAPAAPNAPNATAPTAPAPAATAPAATAPVAAAAATPGAAPTPNENAPMPLGPVRVTASLLNVRRTASTAKSDNIVGELQHGAVVTTTAQHGDWFQIDYEGQPAFVFSHYVTPADAKAAAVSTTANAHAPAAAIAHAGTAPAAPVAPAPVANAGTDHEKHTAPAAEKQPEKAADGTTAKPAANANANAAPAAGVATAQQGKPGEPTTVGNGKESKALKHGKGYVRYGGGTVKNALVQLVQAGKLKLTGAQIAQLDAIAQVETGGQIGCVQTYDNQVVSMGFKQVVLGYGSLEKVMTKAPAGFAKYGLSLDTSAQYTDVTGGHPSKIAGAPDSAALRTQEWGDKFFHASMESDVIAALCDLVLADAKKVDTAIQKDAGGIANFDDPTARAWLLEMYNNRPAYVPYAVRRAAEAGAASAANRNEFLDILANSIVKVYEELEPEFAYRSKVKKHPEYTDEQRTALKHELDAELGPGAAQKGKNIVTKISRNLEIPKVNESETVKQSTPAATPPTTSVIDQHLQQPLPKTHEDAKSSPPPAQAEANKAAEHPQAPKPKKPADQQVATAPTAPATTATAPATATTTHAPAANAPAANAPAANAPAANAPAANAPAATTPAAPAEAKADAGHANANQPVSNKGTASGPALTERHTPDATAKGYHAMVDLGSGLPSAYIAVPPGGVTGTIEAFLFLHGMFAFEDPSSAEYKQKYPDEMNNDPKTNKPKYKDHLLDANPVSEMHLADAMATTKRNMIAIVPKARMDGHHPKWNDLAHGGFRQLIQSAIAHLPADAHRGDVSIGSVSIAGHSAGGSGIGLAAAQMGDNGDLAHDVTMEDGGYSFGASDEALMKWLLKGDVEKLLRVLVHGSQSQDQVAAKLKARKHADPNLKTDDPYNLYNQGAGEANFLRDYIDATDAKTHTTAIGGGIIDWAHKLNVPNVTVTVETASADESAARANGGDSGRSMKNMYLVHRIHINGLKARRTVDVFNMQTDHMDLRNKSTAALIDQDRDSEFQTGGAPAHAPSQAPQTPAEPPKHAANAPDKKQKQPAKQADSAPPPQQTAANAPAASAPASTPSAPGAPVMEEGTAVFADLTRLDALVAAAHNSKITEVANAVHTLSDKSKALTSVKLDKNELKGKDRLEIVEQIKTTRGQVVGLAADIPPPQLMAIKAEMFRALQEVSPYHSQGRNIDILENNAELAALGFKGDKTRTCNITSLSMALEGLGISPASYAGDQAKIVAVANHFKSEVKGGDLQAATSGTGFDALLGLRMPDFMELAAIAHKMKSSNDVVAAAGLAFNAITHDFGFLAELASDFGVSGQVRYFSLDAGNDPGKKPSKESNALEASGSKARKDQRHASDALIDAHNALDQTPDGDSAKQKAAHKKAQAAYDGARGELGAKALGDGQTGIELQKYKAAVLATIGAELAEGHAVETHVVAHFVRVRAVYDEFVVIDDPGSFGRAHKAVRWDEARAEGLFSKRLVLGS